MNTLHTDWLQVANDPELSDLAHYFYLRGCLCGFVATVMFGYVIWRIFN
jgi:hypothetical protein